LGYSNLHKGFKCLDVAEGRVYISRDVVFDEIVFPFSKLHPNVGASLRSEILLLPSSLRNPSDGYDNSSDHLGNDSLYTDHCDEHAGSDENLEANGSNLRPNGHNFMQPGGFPFLARTGTDLGADSLPSASGGSSSDPQPTATALSGAGSSPPRSPSVPPPATTTGE